MYVERGIAISKFWLVCNAIKATIKGAIAVLLDRSPNYTCFRSSGKSVVHTNTGCKPSDHYRRRLESGGGGCGRGGRVYHVGASGIAEPCRLLDRQRAAIILPAPGRKAVKRRANVTGNRRTGGRRVRGSSAIRTSKWETIYMDGRCLWCGGTADVPNRDLCAGCTMHFNDISAETRKLDKRRTDWLGGGKSQ